MHEIQKLMLLWQLSADCKDFFKSEKKCVLRFMTVFYQYLNIHAKKKMLMNSWIPAMSKFDLFSPWNEHLWTAQVWFVPIPDQKNCVGWSHVVLPRWTDSGPWITLFHLSRDRRNQITAWKVAVCGAVLYFMFFSCTWSFFTLFIFQLYMILLYFIHFSVVHDSFLDYFFSAEHDFSLLYLF